MYQLYLIALFPVFIGMMLFFFTKKVAWVEWVTGTALSFLIAGIFHLIAVTSMMSDTETWSGEIVEAVHYPEWIEEYHVTHFTHNSKGEITGTYTTTEHTTHMEYWQASSNIGLVGIDQARFEDIVRKFGGHLEITQPHKSGFDGGDPNIYTSINRTGYIIPVTLLKSFKNKIKASPSLFSFAEVPAEMDTKIYAYPENKDCFVSDRLVGCALNTIDIEKFDAMNSKAGFNKHANIIMVGFVGESASMAEWQRAKWIGGKKNDLVICYGVKSNPYKAEWCRVFGWTEKEDVKRNLESIVMAGTLDNSILGKIQDEVCRNYVIKDWKKFDYITIDLDNSIIIWMAVMMVLTQCGFYIFAMINGINNFKDLQDHFTPYNRYY